MSTPLFTVPEGSSCGLYMECRDDDDALFIPTTVVYSVHDEDTGELLSTDITYTSTGSSFTLTIPTSANALVNQWKEEEVHVVTVSIDWPSNHWNDEIRYNVEKMRFV